DRSPLLLCLFSLPHRPPPCSTLFPYTTLFRSALDESGTGVAKLRSAGIGSAQITATDSPFHAGHGKVEFAWPVAFALATLLGGIVGALLRKDARRHPLGSILIGILAATVVCVAHA